MHPCILDLETCRRCPLNQAPYDPGKPTQGVGGSSPKYMILGEAPGAEESLIGRPFVGASGKLLQQALQEEDFSLDEIYVTNVVKHRPPDNQTPSVEIIEACMPWWLKELETLKPQVIIAVGNIPMLALHASANKPKPKASLHGQVFELEINKNKYKIAGLWHPAYILRNRTKYNSWKQKLGECKNV